MRKITIITSVAALMLTVGLVQAEAQGRGGPRGGGPGVGLGGRPGGGPGRGLPLAGLDLTDAQRASVKEIVAAAKTEVQPLVAELRAKRRATRQAIEAGASPETARAEARTTTENLRAQLAAHRAKVRAAVQGVLTPEQVEKLESRPRPRRGR